MKKTMLWCSLISTALLGSACKKSETEKAGEAVRKQVEEVREQREDLREAQKDVLEEQKDVIKETKDVTEQQRELAQAQGNLAKARANYVTVARERLARIDAKINELEARTDARSKDAAITFRARRDQLATGLDTAGGRIDAQWEGFKKDLDDTFDKLEKDLNDAID